MDRKRSVRRGGRRGHYKKPLSEKLKDYFRNFIAFMFSNVGIIGLVVGYTIAGAFIFIAIEDLPAKQRWTRVEKLRSATAFRLWTLTQNINVFDEQHWRTNCEMELNAFQKSIVEAIIDGYTLDSTSNSTQWSFSGAFLYSLTVITTIGYGNVSPRTEWGKVTTIVYAIIGMPLFLLYLSNIGDILARSFKWTYARCCLCRWCPNVAQRRAQRRRRRERARRRQQLAAVVVEGSTATPSWQRRQSRGEFLDAGAMHLQRLDAVNEDEDSEDDDSEDVATMAEYDPQQVTVPVTICLAMMVGYVCGGAILFSRWEEWDFLDSSYFCFISLSTIGFGDFVPGDKIYSNDRIQLSFIFCSMYLYLGMALIAMCFNLMQEEVVHKIRSILKGIKHMCRCNR